MNSDCQASPGSIKYPNTILVVGTDASGKDHVANIIQRVLQESGIPFERRKRYLCGKKTKEQSSGSKSRLELFAERTFIFLFPFFTSLISWVITLMLEKDIQKFRVEENVVVIVGHNYLRGLALLWGDKYQTVDQIPVSLKLAGIFQKMRTIPGLCILVLDVKDNIRKKRIVQRQHDGEMDNFDRYMLEDSERSERIEKFLVHLVCTYLNGHLIENNDLSEQEIIEIFHQKILQ